ncbi:thioredoxin domain-containing protein [Plantactinospora soyae]|uniref:Thioredoxin domain-containing protein n=1 Tax=Plantactinospora soyae TaxID=1544732 RepID=A0A927RCF7_9ACTN|nr:hypothetical protein [Plantactinospora soyae]MBE1492616.1 hypothetical protein [Plantactinospora soyae]
MMILVAVVIVCVAVTLLNLVLMLGVIRRLRDHSERLVALAETAPKPELMIGPGRRPAPFAVETIDGHRISEADLARGGLVGFFSTTCSACGEWLPRFVEAARALPAGRQGALAVVSGETEADRAEMVAQLREVALVVIERGRKEPLHDAFRITGYPAMGRLDENGTVVSHHAADVVAVPVGA